MGMSLLDKQPLFLSQDAIDSGAFDTAGFMVIHTERVVHPPIQSTSTKDDISNREVAGIIVGLAALVALFVITVAAICMYRW